MMAAASYGHIITICQLLKKQNYSSRHSAFVHTCTSSVTLIAFLLCLSGNLQTLPHLAATILRPSMLVLCFSCHSPSLPEITVLSHASFDTHAPSLATCALWHLCITELLLYWSLVHPSWLFTYPL